MPFPELSLKFKAIVAGLGILLATVGVVAWMNHDRSTRALRESVHQTADGFSASVSAACELPLAVGDQQELARLATRFIEIAPDVELIAIFGPDGHLIAHASRDPATWRAFRSSGESDMRDTIVSWASVQDIAAFPEPLGADGADVEPPPGMPGRVAVGVSLDGLRATQHRQLVSTIVTCAAVMIVAGMLILLVVGHWTGRLMLLVSASDRISRGDLSSHIADERHDEIGTLVRAFEKMRRAIDERDRSERQRREELARARFEAESANAAKSQFLAHMSHEIRTPLNGVVGMLDLIAGTPLDERGRRFVSIASASADALLGIINDILDFSKIEAGQLQIEHIEFELPDLVESVVEMLAARAQDKGLEIVCSIGSEVPSIVRGDPSRLRQVLINLVGNAIKFTNEGEIFVRVSVEEASDEGHRVLIQVRDTGIGIPPDARDRLFKSFSQIDPSTTRRYGGTGLGLAICKSLVELMGGEIGIDEDRAAGSEFRFTVRVEVVESAAEKPSPGRLGVRRVLVVDDNETNRAILMEALAQWGLDPVEAAHAHDALAILESAETNGSPMELVILDMQMPDMDGLQLADAIVESASIGAPRMLMLSSISGVWEPGELESHGIRASLSKPVRLSVLLETLVALTGDDEADPVDPAEDVPAGGDLSSLRGARVLVAEDNAVNQIVVAELLDSHGIETTIVGNGQEAVDAWEAGDFDAILMDCEMPVMDGMRATGVIRRRERAAGHDRPTPIIALTANAVQGDRDRCIAAGMTDYHPKPITPPVLLGLLASLVEPVNRPAGPIAGPPRPVEPAEAYGPAAVEVAPVEATAIDVEQALNRCGGSPAVLAAVLEEYERMVRQQLVAIDRAVLDGCFDEVSSIAHGLKGASANVGAAEAGERAAELERLGTDASSERRAAAITALRDAIDRVMRDSERARHDLRDQSGEMAA